MALIEINWSPDPKQLRVFGCVGAIAFGVAGTWALWRKSLVGFQLEPETARVLGVSLLASGGACLLLAVFMPSRLRILHRVLTALTLPIGFVMSYVILGIVFYGILLPTGLLLRSRGRDALKLKPDHEAASYWEKREANREAVRYFRQF